MELNWTGERLITDENLGMGVIEHLHRYAIALHYAKEKSVLDLACGEGYGSYILSQHASSVIGVDISPDAIDHAQKKYKRSNLVFRKGSATAIPLEDKSVDCITSFETIEHHSYHHEMMLEFKRVLKDDGVLVISTPERENYRKVIHGNPYHILELSFDEFSSLLQKYFLNISYFHQRFFQVSFIYPARLPFDKMEEYSGDFSQIHERDFNNNHIFNIAICSNGNVPVLNKGSFFDGTSFLNSSLKNNYEKIIKDLKGSASYRLGNFMVRPVSFLKKKFSK
jgi:SAM-dependent methyltransferase